MRAYIRPLGEPNRCLNVYASYDCGGALRGAEHRPYWYRQAFRRIYILVHGGGKLAKIDSRRRAGLGRDREANRVRRSPPALPKGPGRGALEPAPAGSPSVRWNRPERFYPGRAYTDWDGTDFYSDYPDWKSLNRLYDRFRGRPFVLTEWGVAGRDDPHLRQAPVRLGQAPSSDQDARLLPGLRHGQPLPHPELPGQPRRDQTTRLRRQFPALRIRTAASFHRQRGRPSSRPGIASGAAGGQVAASVALAGIVVLGAALRFATLDLQSYRYDEAVTVGGCSTRASSTPLARPPQRVDAAALLPSPGSGRASSVPARSACARSRRWRARPRSRSSTWARWRCRCARRAGLIAAAMVAVSPVLIWFSQDARAYSLAFLLTALSFLFFARARRSARRGTCLVGGLLGPGAGTHYFAGFVVVPEAVLLLLWTSERRACGSRLAIVAIAPLARLLCCRSRFSRPKTPTPAGSPNSRCADASNAPGRSWSATTTATSTAPASRARSRSACRLALALAALTLLLWRGDPAERRSAGVAAAVGVRRGRRCRWPLGRFRRRLPGRAQPAAGFRPADPRPRRRLRRPARRLGGALAWPAAFCLCSLVFTIEIDRLPRLQREDLRNAADQIGPPRPGVAVVTIRYAASQPLLYYLGASLARRPASTAARNRPGRLG